MLTLTKPTYNVNMAKIKDHKGRHLPISMFDLDLYHLTLKANIQNFTVFRFFLYGYYAF